MKFTPFLSTIISKIVVATAFLLIPAAYLQGQIYNVSRYTTSDNLVQSQVMTMLQDRHGFLWFGTHRGPCKFDGHSFEALPPDSLAGTFLTDMWENTANGKLYFATQSGITTYDGYHFGSIIAEDSISKKPVLCFLSTSPRRLWIGTQSQGIQWLDPSHSDSLLDPFAGQQELIGKRRIQGLAKGKEGSVWIGTDKGLYQCDSSGGNMKRWMPETLGNLDIYKLYYEQERSALWIGTNVGAYLWNGRFLTLFEPTRHGGTDNGVYCFTKDHDGQIWMGTRKGVVYMDQEGNIQPLQKLDNSLDFHMRSALTDREGNIWFGTDGGGARMITPGVFQAYTMGENLSSNQAKSFLKAPNGDIWISTRDRGIDILRMRNEEYEVVQTLTTNNSALGGDDICFSYEDKAGRFWFASYNGSLSRWDHSTQAFEVYGESKGLICNAVYVVNEEDDILWIGTDNGLFQMVNDRITGHMTTADGLSSNVIYAMYHDNEEGNFWVGSSAALSKRKTRSTFETFEADSTIIGQTVIALEKDHTERLWVGSAIGLAWIKEGKAHRVHISNTDGAHTIIGLEMEDDRYLWIASENGVYRLDLRTFQENDPNPPNFEHFSQKDGLPSMECNANALFVDDKAGNIWVGTAEGAIRKSSIQERENGNLPPLVYITKVGVENQTDWRKEDTYQVNDFGLPIGLELPANQNRVDFSWIGICLRSPQQVEYKFYLKGLDEGWPESGSRQSSFSYPNLDPGTYTFFLTAKKEEEPWNYEKASTFTFTILPPYYQRWWFVLLMLLLIGAVAYLIFRFVTQRRRQQQEEQKIRDTAEKLQLEHQALYAMMNPHFTFNALNAIKLFIHRQDRKAADKFLSSFAKLVRMNLESTKTDFISLEEELRRLELFMDLTKVRFPEKLEAYRVKVDEDVELYDTRIPPMLLQPFVENSIEHGIKPLDSGGIIEVHVSRLDDDYLKIMIRDNGIGIEASKAAKEGRPKDHVSRGMQITLDRLKLFARMTGKKYSLDLREMKNSEGEPQGTEVEMILPVSFRANIER
ncbi:MAG: histidine kinase [Bacteroidia bacterium]|nr:histidine kinase [Bacteroidia bacterium]